MLATRKSLFVRVAGFLVVMIAISAAFAAEKERVLHTFYDKPSANPSSNLIFDAEGNLYGSTGASGYQPCQCGTIFRLIPQRSGNWKYQVIYQFTGQEDGGYPLGNLVFDTAGNLYGAMGYGYGGVFRLMPQSDGSWNESTIYSFKGAPDSSTPYAGLTIDRSGNLYGTTRVGGVNGLGDVYKLTRTSNGQWSESVLYSFSGTDGAFPWSDVTIDGDSNLYGTTIAGGQFGSGVVFKLIQDQAGWSERVLYSFEGGANHGEPASGVYRDTSGNLYTTASDNGAGYPGALFELMPASDDTYTGILLHTFGSSGDGEAPWSDLIPDAHGDLYGTTFIGGTLGYGVIYKLSRDDNGDWSETVFHSFDYRDGAAPFNNPVTFNASGDLFIATSSGGLHEGYDGYGVVLEIVP